MESLLELFCDVDDFSQSLMPARRNQLLSASEIQRLRNRSLSVSEIMTILIPLHQSHYCDFKAYYMGYVQGCLPKEFSSLSQLYTFCGVHSIGSDSVMGLLLTLGNVDDRQFAPRMVRKLIGKLFFPEIFVKNGYGLSTFNW
jgi:hypothetical protein